MFVLNRAPIKSPSSDDDITKLQTTLNNILHCLTDALYLLPDSSPKVTGELQILNSVELEALKHDILYRANYISTGLECTENIILKLTDLTPLSEYGAKNYFQRIQVLGMENKRCNEELKGMSEKCRAILNELNSNVKVFINDSIDKDIAIHNTENIMEMVLNEMYKINW
ncbi:Helicase associated domain (HA2) family protein [Cryptosporidium felis]|nr:Helicase associated domain (HA2) family protein [Cryptosporidium felis]